MIVLVIFCVIHTELETEEFLFAHKDEGEMYFYECQMIRTLLNEGKFYSSNEQSQSCFMALNIVGSQGKRLSEHNQDDNEVDR